MRKSESGRDVRGTRGVFVLTVSGLLVKAAGLLFKIPMNYAVGDAGMGYYNAAYSVFALLYTLFTAGLPVALSVMIAERRTRGDENGAETTYRRTLGLMTLFGCAGCLLMLAGAEPLAGLIRSPGSEAAVRSVAPALLFICAASAVRGWFQGCGDMTPTAVSQLAEAAGKLICGLAGAVFAVSRGYAAPIAAAYAAAGLSAGSFVSMVYLLAVRGKGKKRRRCREEAEPLIKTLRALCRIAVPVTLSASVMSLSSAMDTVSVQRILRELGATAEEAAARFGNYTSLAVPLFNLPPVLVYPAAYALVPSAASALAAGDRREAAKRIMGAMRIAVLIGVPCACGLAALADPILCLLFRDASAHAASPLLTILAPASFLLCLTAVTNAGLQASGGQRLTVLSMAAGAALKWGAGELLLRRFGIVGAPLSTLLSYAAVAGLNLAFLHRRVGAAFPLGTAWSSLTAGAGCALSARWVYGALLPSAGSGCAVSFAILAAVPVYVLLLILTGGVGAEERAMLKRWLPGRAVPSGGRKIKKGIRS